MKKAFFIVFTSLLTVVCFAQDKVIIDSNAEVRTVNSFHSIRVSHTFDIYLTEGNEEKLAVSATDKKFIEQMKTEVKDGELHIWHDGGNIKNWNPAKMKLKVYISFKQLDKLDVTDQCHVYARGKWKDESLKKKLLETVHSR
jgi:Putative auto-transporter adhesin, head GIN domain